MRLWRTGRKTTLAFLGMDPRAGWRSRATREGSAQAETASPGAIGPGPAQSERMVHPSAGERGQPGAPPGKDAAPCVAVDQHPSLAAGRMAPAGGNGSVLLIEANRVNRQVIGGVLVRAGYDVAAVEDTAAVAGTDAAFDIMVVDVDAGGNGLDISAARMLRGAFPDRPPRAILALAADSSPEFRARCKGAGFLDLISKPVRPAALIEALAALPAIERAGLPATVAAGNPAPSTASSPDAAAIDAATLDSLERLGGADFVDELANQFVEDATTTLAELAATVEAADAPAFREHAHALRSAAANIGAVGMYEMCLAWREIEPPALTEHGPQIVIELTKEFERVRAVLEQVQATRPRTGA